MRNAVTEKHDLMQNCLDRLREILFADPPMGDAQTASQAMAVILEYEIQRDTMMECYEREQRRNR